MKVASGMLTVNEWDISGAFKKEMNFMKVLYWAYMMAINIFNILIWFFINKPIFKRNVGPQDRPLEEFEFREPSEWQGLL